MPAAAWYFLIMLCPFSARSAENGHRYKLSTALPKAERANCVSPKDIRLMRPEAELLMMRPEAELLIVGAAVAAGHIRAVL